MRGGLSLERLGTAWHAAALRWAVGRRDKEGQREALNRRPLNPYEGGRNPLRTDPLSLL